MVCDAAAGGLSRPAHDEACYMPANTALFWQHWIQI